MTAMELLGIRLKDLRERKGWNANQLAKESGVNQAVIWRLEHGKSTKVDMMVVRRLARTLGTSVDHLIGTHEPDVERMPATEALVDA